PRNLPKIPRPSNAQFLMDAAAQQFTAGKKSVQEGRMGEARQQFDRSIEILLSEEAPQNPLERRRLEQRLDQYSQAIYEYDLDELGAGEMDDEAVQERPADEILEMTFPIDPNLRSLVREQVAHATSDLPLDATDAVLGAINYFSTERGRKVLQWGLARSGKYGDVIRRVLADRGLPQELIYVAQLESAFNPRAVSYAAAVGMWQFVHSAGTEHGLYVSNAVDDRMDPEKATYAAASYLGELYNHFGDWHLALAAYNCGPGCVDSAIRRTGYADFWELSRLHALPQQTQNYVPVVVAMAIMAKNMDAYDLSVDYDAPVDYDSIELEANTHIALAAAAVEQPLSELKALNPALLRSVAPKGYMLHLPKGSLERLNEVFAVIPAAQRDSWRIHRVEDSDTLASLAKKYKVGAAALSSANNGEIPEVGSFAAVPVAYPGDPQPKKKAVKGRTTTKGRSVSKPAPKAVTASKAAVQSKPATKAVVKTAKPAAKAPARVTSKKAPTSTRAGA
ncbi:MAG: transglycosylase SLT domain-containing protein, partial [Acidobacteriota bacterium]